MSGKVIEFLNTARAHDLRAIRQFMSQHYELDNQGYGKLASTLKGIGLEEMKHAEALAERIVWLGSEPVSEPTADITESKNILEMLKADIDQEAGAIQVLKEAIGVCVAEADQISKRVLEKLLKESERHLLTFEHLEDHVDRLGPSYLATLTTE